MRLSFRVFLAVAALAVSMAVSADSECKYPGSFCTTDRDCCPGNVCVSNEIDPDVSMSDLMDSPTW